MGAEGADGSHIGGVEDKGIGPVFGTEKGIRAIFATSNIGLPLLWLRAIFRTRD